MEKPKFFIYWIVDLIKQSLGLNKHQKTIEIELFKNLPNH